MHWGGFDMYDCIIIGAGISGCSLAFELSKHSGSVLLLEKENDVACGTTKANSAVLHAGYDPQPDTRMAKYNVEGNRIIPQICADLDVPLKRIGSLVLAFSKEEVEILKDMKTRGEINGVSDMRIVEKEELHIMEPNLSDNAVAALWAPSAAIMDPWGLAIAYAETAITNGAELQLKQEVKHIEKRDDGFVVKTDTQVFYGRTIVNVAGVDCDRIVGMVKKPEYEIEPNKGEYYLLDKSQGDLVNHIIFQCPTKKGKGTLVAPTIHGNLIVGPSSAICDADDVSTTQMGLDMVKAAALKSIPSIRFQENIRTFAGIRARRKDHGDFVIGEDADVEGFFQIAAMQSPGLSSASAIAVDMVKELQKKGLFMERKANAVTTRKLIHFKEMSLQEKNAYIQTHPAYGRIICRCETISEGEIVEALHRVIPPVSLDGVKRRCHAGMGRCQGGFCGPRVQELIAKEQGIALEDVVQDKAGSVILLSKTKEGKR